MRLTMVTAVPTEEATAAAIAVVTKNLPIVSTMAAVQEHSLLYMP